MSKIVDFKDLGQRSIQRKRKGYACHHRRVTINETERSLSCRDCGQRLDVYDWMLAWAHKEEAEASVRDTLLADIKRLKPIKEELQREVRNLKAQKRRWEAK